MGTYLRKFQKIDSSIKELKQYFRDPKSNYSCKGREERGYTKNIEQFYPLKSILKFWYL